jgi:hypothetical protein
MSDPCSITAYAKDKDLFMEWFNASDAYIDSLSMYSERTWLAYTMFRTVGVNEYLRNKRIPSDSWNTGSSNYFIFEEAFRPQIKAYYKLRGLNKAPKDIPENLKIQFINEAIETLRQIIANAPRTTTEFLVFRALRQKYDPSYITGFMSTGTNFQKLRMYMTHGGQYICIRVPVGTPCIIGNGELCEIFFSDNVKLNPIEPLGLPEIDANNGLYFEIVSPVKLTGGSKLRKRKNTKKKARSKVRKHH